MAAMPMVGVEARVDAAAGVAEVVEVEEMVAVQARREDRCYCRSTHSNTASHRWRHISPCVRQSSDSRTQLASLLVSVLPVRRRLQLQPLVAAAAGE